MNFICEVLFAFSAFYNIIIQKNYNLVAFRLQKYRKFIEGRIR